MSNKAFLYWHLCSKMMQVVSAEEFCNSEISQPYCHINEVIYITWAPYGRREYGRCLKKEVLDENLLKKPGYTNCSSDVREVIETQCAGEKHCKFHVAKIKSNTSCLTFALKHLEVSHKCTKSRCINYEFEMVPLY